MRVYKRSKPSKSICNRVREWCIQNYGRSKYNGSYPFINFTSYYYISKKDNKNINPKNHFGEYNPWENKMIISKHANDTVNKLIDTIIHEWVHYLQPVKTHINKVMKLDKKLSTKEYNNLPFEKEAVKIAKKDRNKCFQDLFINNECI